MFRSTKTFGNDRGLSCCFRQWRAESHCNQLHGYSIGVRFVFESETLDHRNWVMDFGAFKAVKDFLDWMFDHKTLVAMDDPYLKSFEVLEAAGVLTLRRVNAVGCEKFAEMIFNNVQPLLGKNGRDLVSVEVFEHGANSATFIRPTVAPTNHDIPRS